MWRPATVWIAVKWLFGAQNPVGSSSVGNPLHTSTQELLLQHPGADGCYRPWTMTSSPGPDSMHLPALHCHQHLQKSKACCPARLLSGPSEHTVPVRGLLASRSVAETNQQPIHHQGAHWTRCNPQKQWRCVSKVHTTLCADIFH